MTAFGAETDSPEPAAEQEVLGEAAQAEPTPAEKRGLVVDMLTGFRLLGHLLVDGLRPDGPGGRFL